MSAVAAAEAAATTNWRLYDGPVPADLLFWVILLPSAMGLLLLAPVLVCYFALSRGRVVEYSPRNMPGGGGFGTRPIVPSFLCS